MIIIVIIIVIIMIIVNRRRAISRTHYEDYKNKIATKSVNNATPFVDKSRITNTSIAR